MASRPPKPPDAFLSYTRFDDQHDGGAISQFRLRLASAVHAVTGQPFEIFQDVDGIGLGERWRGKLDEMLDETRFFIPIVTPSYFTSKACRDEFEKFLRAEADRGRDDLVLPIYYIESDVLEDEDLRNADPLATLIHERQRQDWRELRFETFGAREVRKELERLAREIVRARRRIAPRRSRTSTPGSPTKSGPSGGPQGPADQTSEDVEALLTRSRRAVKRLDTGLARLRGDRPPIEAGRLPWSSGFPPPARLHADQSLHVSSGHAVGKAFRDIDAPWCPEMVVIPPGEFLMGSPELDTWAEALGETPPHRVRIAAPLAVGRYPVTFEQYDHFARCTKRELPDDAGWGRDRRPVINVSWDDAKAFVEWLAMQTDQVYRLLSEAEWEYACRAGTTTQYWWGDEPTPDNANYGHRVGRTSEVGSYPANPFGLCDTHGNAFEWVEDCWNESYAGAPDDGSAWTTGDCKLRVLRGGSWQSFARTLRAAFRRADGPGERHVDIGFRVARTFSLRESVTS